MNLKFMKSLNEKIREHYDRTQLFYNLFWFNERNLGMHYGFWEKGVKNLHEAILNENKVIADKLEIKKTDVVLDAGCGVGGTSIWLAENHGVDVTGITLSQKQVGLARKYAKKRKLDHLTRFEVKDFCDTGFPNESFTKVFGLESVCNAEKKENFVKEAYRILKAGGKLAVADFFVKERLDKEEKELVEGFCRGWEMPNLLTLAEFQRMLKEAGFKNINCIDKTKEIEPSSKRMFIVMGKLVRTILKILEFLKLHTSSGGTIATVNQYYIFKRRIATYNLFLAEK